MHIIFSYVGLSEIEEIRNDSNNFYFETSADYHSKALL